MGREGGYRMGDGQWAEMDNVTLAPQAEYTATVTLDAVEIGDKGTLRLDLDMTVTGTLPTLDVTIETSNIEGGTYRSLGTFAQLTATGSARKSFAGCDRWARAVLTIGGTNPSFTGSITGEAV